MKTLEKYDAIRNFAFENDINECAAYAAMLIEQEHNEDPKDILDYLHCYVLWEFHDSRNDDFDVVEMKRDLFLQVFHDYNPPSYWFDDEDWKEGWNHMQEVYDRNAIGEYEEELDFMLRDMGVENVVFFDYMLYENEKWNCYRYVAYTDIL